MNRDRHGKDPTCMCVEKWLPKGKVADPIVLSLFSDYRP